MLEPFYFVLGLANNIFLIIIFLLRKKYLSVLEKIGWLYVLLAIPAIYAIYLVYHEQKSSRYTIFLVIFLAFLLIETLYDYVLKIPFRETMNWTQLMPYVALYISMNYGFVVMVWKYDSSTRGMVLLIVLAIQLIANLVTHPRSTTVKS